MPKFIQRQIGAIPHFRRSIYEKAGLKGGSSDREDYELINYWTFEDLQKAEIPYTESTLCIFPTVTYKQLTGICAWMKSFEPEIPPLCVMSLIYETDWRTDGERKTYIPKLYQNSFNCYDEKLKHRILLVTKPKLFMMIIKKCSEILGI